jgi:hypothetical protein
MCLRRSKLLAYLWVRPSGSHMSSSHRGERRRKRSWIASAGGSGFVATMRKRMGIRLHADESHIWSGPPWG